MVSPSVSSRFISSEQKFQYQMTHPFYLAIDERIVTEHWPSRDLHWHDYFEIEIILNGSGTHLYNDTRFPLSQGCAYLLTPMDIHALIPDPGPDSNCHLVHLRFDEQAISEEVRQILLQHEHIHSVKMDDFHFSRLLSQLTELLHCFESDTPHQELSIRLILSYLCLHIIKTSQHSNDRFPNYETANPVVHQTLQYILYNFRKKITMQELGQKAHVSPNHLALLFKQSTGTTCMQMIADLRMQYALKLLENPNLSIETISEQSGFSAVSYFISVFRKRFGITPKEFQNRNKTEKRTRETDLSISPTHEL